MRKLLTLCLFFILFNFGLLALKAEEAVVAVAANFHTTLKVLKNEFEKSSEHRIIIVSGSTGKLFAQIINGAPFDIFMSADKERPLLLEKNSIGIKNSRFIYANGRLVLWSLKNNFVDNLGEILLSDKYTKIALANPKLAPYGRAAMELLNNMQLKSSKFSNINEKIVRGENISHTFHLVASGSAEIGFVALSQLKDMGETITGSFWIVPELKHKPIEQHAIVLNNNEAVTAFVSFMQSEKGKKLIENFGYQVPKLLLSDKD
jgi:molybdate transport system substrate-binding protein